MMALSYRFMSEFFRFFQIVALGRQLQDAELLKRRLPEAVMTKTT